MPIPVRLRHFLVMMIALITPGCGFQDESHDQTKLRVMAEAWMFKKYLLREAKERFETNHPGVEVDLIKAPDGWPNRLLVAMMSGRSDFDVFFGTVETNVAAWAARDLLIPWDDYIVSHPSLQREAFIPSFYDNNRFGDLQYGLPVSAELTTFSVNKEMAATAGLLDNDGNVVPAKSWEEVFDYARKMTTRDENGHVTTVGFAGNWTYANSMLLAALKAERGQLKADDETDFNIDTPEVRTFLRLTREGLAEGITTAASMTDVNQPRSDLKARLVAMILTSHSRYLEAQEVLGEGSTTIMPVPGSAGAAFGGTRTVVVPRNSHAIDLARSFVKEEMFEPYFARFAWEKYGKLPCQRELFETLDEPEAAMLAEWAEASKEDPMFRDETALVDAIKRNVQRYLTGEIELDPMMDQLGAELARLNLTDIRTYFGPKKVASR